MSRSSFGIVACCVAAVGMAPALAHSSEAAIGPAAPDVGNTVLIARFQCNTADLARVDQILKDSSGPVLNRMVAEGKIITWGVLATYVGGPDTRSIYVWAKDPVALVKARAEYLPEIQAKPGWSEVARACPVQEVSLNNMVLKAQIPAK